MILGRIIGWITIMLALMAVGAETFVALRAGAYQGLTGGEIWFKIDSHGLNTVQAVVQRYIHPILWDPAIVSVLRLPLWATLGSIGSILLLIYRKRGRRISN